MSAYRNELPQMNGKVCITDGGLETELCFNKQIELPEFAAYDLLRDDAGYSILFDYYKTYVEIANRNELGLILETPTWRASRDWGDKIGDSLDNLHQFNLRSVKLIEQLRDEFGKDSVPIVISGCLGPRGDGYVASTSMTPQEACEYHSQQIQTFAKTNVDMICGLTLNYVDEAIGVVQAAQAVNMPVCISFTVETDGHLPTGQTIKKAIELVDEATNNGPAYYMINCAHPTHFKHLFESESDWARRIKGIRGNASCMSHAELDESEELDDGNPNEFGEQLNQLKELLPSLTVLGGCCGTDHRHIESICQHIH